MSQGMTERAVPRALPASLADWRICTAQLQQKQSEIDAERASLAVQRRELSLAAATGDSRAQKRVAQLASREQALELDTVNISQGLAQANAEVATGEANLAETERRQAIIRHGEMLESRLLIVAEIERGLQSVAPLLANLAALTHEIEESHIACGGTRPTLPPLAQEAAGGRLAEFMTGAGFAAWLPLARPEIRPAIESWAEAERVAQACYQLPA